MKHEIDFIEDEYISADIVKLNCTYILAQDSYNVRKSYFKIEILGENNFTISVYSHWLTARSQLNEHVHNYTGIFNL